MYNYTKNGTKYDILVCVYTENSENYNIFGV